MKKGAFLGRAPFYHGGPGGQCLGFMTAVATRLRLYPPPLNANSVTYSDGTKATIEQEAHDVTTFLAWASEPKMEERKRVGFGVMVFLIALAGILFTAYRKVWADKH